MEQSKERAIGEEFECRGKKYRVVKAHKSGDCRGCATCSAVSSERSGVCSANLRKDKTYVIFKEVKEVKDDDA